MQNFPTEQLKEWFLANRRSLPWRENITPYRIWISEVMLQQTQVAVVIPYFEKWMAQFPTIEALAKAPLDEVLKCWEGLGYYSRAKNLHAAAQYVVSHFQGELPTNGELLGQIKGIGPYTQGAIRSFAFKQKAAAVDGNVLRVLSRFLAFDEDIDAPKSKMKLHNYAEWMLPDEEPWLVSEGLIELGATICAKKAKCQICPVKKGCMSYRHHLQDTLPKKRVRPKTIVLHRIVAVIQCQGRYLLKREGSGKVMADLYEFPYLEGELMDVRVSFEKELGLQLRYQGALAHQQHSFTRFRAHLFPHLFEAEDFGHSSLIWKTEEEIQKLPFSSGHRRILNAL